MTPLDEDSALRRGLYPHNTQHIQETNVHVPAGFEPEIQAREGPQIVLDRAATGIGICKLLIFTDRIWILISRLIKFQDSEYQIQLLVFLSFHT
jgi:hypothetical protein